MLNSHEQLQFNPMKPHLLYAAYRGCGTGMVYSWDIRSDVDAPLEIFQVSSVFNAKSDVRTNQKMRFDVDIGGRFLSVGDQVRDYGITRKTCFNSDIFRWAISLSSTSKLETGPRMIWIPSPQIRMILLDREATSRRRFSNSKHTTVSD